MAWSSGHDFRLSASLHQGALVANYPFDSCDTQVGGTQGGCVPGTKMVGSRSQQHHQTRWSSGGSQPSRTDGGKLSTCHPEAATVCSVNASVQAVVRYCPTLDDPLPVFLARSYAINHPKMRHSTNSTTQFVQGTVQGAQWYTLLGGMQVS